MALYPSPSRKFEWGLVRFQPTDAPERPWWGVLEVGSRLSGRWLLFVDTQGEERRRLSTVPPGWRSLSPAELTAHWERATVVPKVTLHRKRDRRPPIDSRTVPSGVSADEENLLWERERRIAAERLLEDAVQTIEELEQELKYTNDDLRALNEEVQALVQGLISEKHEPMENDAERAAPLEP